MSEHPADERLSLIQAQVDELGRRQNLLHQAALADIATLQSHLDAAHTGAQQEATSASDLERVKSEPRGFTPPAGAIPNAPFEISPTGKVGAPIPARSSATNLNLEDIASPRNLAIAGALAVIAGLIFLVSLGIQQGWISPLVRILGAACISAAFISGSELLQRRQGQMQSGLGLGAAGIAGGFATLVAAVRLYDLISLELGLSIALGIAVISIYSAMQWRSEWLAVIGTCSALLVPVFLEVPADATTLAFVLILYGGINLLFVLQGWSTLLALGAAIVLLQTMSAPLEIDTSLMLTGWGALALIPWVSAICRWYREHTGEHPVAHQSRGAHHGLVVLVLMGSSMSTWVAGWVHLHEQAGDGAISGWVYSYAAAHLLIACGLHMLILRRRMRTASLAIRDLAYGLGLALLVLGLSESLDQTALALSWLVLASSLLLMADHYQVLVWKLAGVVTYTLAIGHIIAYEAPLPEWFASTPADISKGLVSLLTLSAVAAITAWFSREPEQQRGLAVISAVALAAGAGYGISGLALVGAWALFALVCLLFFSRRIMLRVFNHEGTLLAAGFFAALAGLHVLAYEATPEQVLWDGFNNTLIGSASLLMLAAVTGSALYIFCGQRRLVAGAISVGALIYLASGLIITGLTGHTATASSELSSQQFGQALLSGFWALCGFMIILFSVRRSLWVRSAGLLLIFTACAKIILFDLSSLDALSRTISFVIVGLVLLATAYLYQRNQSPHPPAP